jgi:hypothetical protein
MVTGYGKLRIWLVDLFPRNGFVTKVMLAEILRNSRISKRGVAQAREPEWKPELDTRYPVGSLPVTDVARAVLRAEACEHLLHSLAEEGKHPSFSC